MRTWMTVLILFWTGVACAAGVYRWTDASGGVHYGEHPPPGMRSQQIPMQDTPIAPSTDDEAARDAKRDRLLHAFDQEQADQQAQAAKAQKQEALRARRCILARDQLRTYNDSGLLYNLDANGNRHYLNDSQRNAAIKEAKDAVAQWCD